MTLHPRGRVRSVRAPIAEKRTTPFWGAGDISVFFLEYSE